MVGFSELLLRLREILSRGSDGSEDRHACQERYVHYCACARLAACQNDRCAVQRAACMCKHGTVLSVLKIWCCTDPFFAKWSCAMTGCTDQMKLKY
jgi:hypothetical protein